MKRNIMKASVTNLAISWTLTAIQTSEIFQIIGLVLNCIATLVVILFTLWKWYITAKKDGKITSEEIQEGINIVSDGLDALQDDLSDVDDQMKGE